jgi:hypothetical protein
MDSKNDYTCIELISIGIRYTIVIDIRNTISVRVIIIVTNIAKSVLVVISLIRIDNFGAIITCITVKKNCKVEKILKGSLDLISSAKIQIMGGKVCLRHRGKTLLGIVNKLQMFVENIQQCFAHYPPIISIFNEGDGIKSRLSSKII